MKSAFADEIIFAARDDNQGGMRKVVAAANRNLSDNADDEFERNLRKIY